MKAFSNMVSFAVGAACGVGALMGADALTKNKEQVKKTINDKIDHVAYTMK